MPQNSEPGPDRDRNTNRASGRDRHPKRRGQSPRDRGEGGGNHESRPPHRGRGQGRKADHPRKGNPRAGQGKTERRDQRGTGKQARSWDRDERPAVRGPAGRGQRGGGERAGSWDRGERPGRGETEAAEERPLHPGQHAAADEPATPSDFDESELAPAVRAELKGLSLELAAVVGAHIQAAGELIQLDPELAWKHAEAARRRAGRIPIVREAAAETAYAAGRYDVALREFRALRRMSGNQEFLPAIADCERALGRPRDALAVLEGLDRRSADLGLQVECLLVEIGVREDLGQRAEAIRLLRNAISRKAGPKTAQARLRYAYAERLLAAGEPEQARAWFEAAEKLDTQKTLDATERIAEIDGITLPEDMSEPQSDELEPEEETDDTVD